MKKVFFIGAMMLGMISINNLFAQTPQQLQQLNQQRGEGMMNNIKEMGGCVDNDDWMTAEGFGQSAKNPQIARTTALNNANNEIIKKMQSYVERIAKGMSHSEINEATDDVYGSMLTDRFMEITQGMRGRIRECFAVPESGTRGYTCRFVVAISLKDFNKELKEAISNDKTLRAQTKMEEFDKIADESWDAIATRRDGFNSK